MCAPRYNIELKRSRDEREANKGPTYEKNNRHSGVNMSVFPSHIAHLSREVPQLPYLDACICVSCIYSCRTFIGYV